MSSYWWVQGKSWNSLLYWCFLLPFFFCFHSPGSTKHTPSQLHRCESQVISLSFVTFWGVRLGLQAVHYNMIETEKGVRIHIILLFHLSIYLPSQNLLSPFSPYFSVHFSHVRSLLFSSLVHPSQFAGQPEREQLITPFSALSKDKQHDTVAVITLFKC